MTPIFQQNIFNFFERMNKKTLSVLVVSLVLLIYCGDYLVGPLTPFTHFYIVPIFIAALFLDRTSANFVTILATIVGTPFLQQAEANYTTFELFFNLFSDASIFYAVLLMSTHLKKLLNELKEQGNYDFLTTAYNKKFFIEVSNLELAISFREKQPAALIFIDLDNFKQVNDEHGNQMGDKLLLDLATSIKASLREGDLLGRFGGDEFGILLQNTTKDQADILITEIKVNLINANAHLKSNITLSFGVVIYNGDKKTSIERLLALADSAIYSVKHSTNNAIKYVFA